MIAAIHQPNYLPWLGYFHKIYSCDVFVFLDNVQFPIGRSLLSRNKIKVPQGWAWLTVPVQKKGKSGQSILDVCIDNETNWQKKHWESLWQNYKKAQYFDETSGFFENLYRQEWVKLAELNETIIIAIAKMLGIKCHFTKASNLQTQGTSNTLLISICKSVGADIYLSGLGGTNYMDGSMFEEHGITVVYQDFKHPVYNQLHGGFIPNLSIIDLLFNYGHESLTILANSSYSRNQDDGHNGSELGAIK